MGLYWPNFSLVFLIHLFLYAGVYCIYNSKSELAFVHLFDLHIVFMGVFPTHQDLNDNVTPLLLYRVPLESRVHLQY